MKTDADYIEKQSIQAGQYEVPYHWESEKKVEAYRYKKTTEYFTSLLKSHARLLGADEITVLDFGCGDGYGAYLLARLLEEQGVKASVYGVDVEETAIQWASKLTENAGSLALRFCVGDIRLGVELASGNAGPLVVVMREVIEHLPESDIDEILQYLNEQVPEAKLIISVPSTNSPTEEKHFRHYTAQTLREVLQRNNYAPDLMAGFGFRPAGLYWALKRVKAVLNRRGSRFWWLMNPLWRVVRPEWAITLVAMAGSTRRKA